MRLHLNETWEGINNVDDYTHLHKLLPQHCINQCSASGDQYETCKRWVKRLGLSIPRDQYIRELKEFGAWDDDELEDLTDFSLNVKYLWIASGWGN